MAISNQELLIFAEIQKKLFYMIPERWDAIYLYASVIEEPSKKPVGEMYFYYIPKGILKRKAVNVYQIPGMFNIDEEGYNDLIQKLYANIKELREVHRQTKESLWTNLTISIKNSKFKIDYSYEDLGMNSEFTPYERHIIWRFKNLEDDAELMNKDEKEIISRYLSSDLIQVERSYDDSYTEGIYEKPVHNIIEYEKTLTVEAALAAQNAENEDRNKTKKLKIKRQTGKKKEVTNRTDVENQLLLDRVEKMKKMSSNIEKKQDDFDDDMILSSDYMTRKE